MRKTIVMAAVAACMFVSNVFAQRIKGSDTCLPLSQTEAENFINKNKSAKITVTGGGSGVGISALMEGTTDIAMSSRKMKFDEKVKLQEAKKSTKEVVIAYDALAVVVHPSNKVSNLTREQLEGIFTGKIKNWKEVGGADMKIVAYSRETSSGTYEFFKESVLKNKNYMNGILSMPATGAIIQSVSQTKGAIGYVGLAYINKEVKPIHVSYDAGKTFTEPSFENAKNKAYPIVRPLFYYYDVKNEGKVKPFIDYILSAEGQATVKQVGYTLIISTHQVHDVESLLDHIIIMNQSQLLLDASVSDICGKYTFEYRNPQEMDDTVLYAEPTLQGNAAICKRQEGEQETQMNLELLFNAVISGKLTE